jgi:hypothetical protein
MFYEDTDNANKQIMAMNSRDQTQTTMSSMFTSRRSVITGGTFIVVKNEVNNDAWHHRLRGVLLFRIYTLWNSRISEIGRDLR